MRGWESFLNWQSDGDWTWGPLLPLRPPKDAPIRPWVWVRLFLVFTLLGILVLGCLMLLCVLLPLAASRQHQSLPAPLLETILTLTAMLRDPAILTLLICLVLSLPVLFFTFCLPYHWAWNRRAARLRAVDLQEPDVPLAGSDDWPPPIRP